MSTFQDRVNQAVNPLAIFAMIVLLGFLFPFFLMHKRVLIPAKLVATGLGIAVLYLAMHATYQGYGMRGAIMVMFLLNAALAALWYGCVLLLGITLMFKVNQIHRDQQDKSGRDKKDEEK